MQRILLAAVVAAWASWPAAADEPKWKKHTIGATSEFEAAGALDVDGDCKLDIVSGGFWYKAPEWTQYPIREVTRTGTYLNDFAVIPIDADGDGDKDFVTAAYFSKDVGWVENPGKLGEKWTYHLIDTPGPSEAAAAVDLSGDGVPDILPNSTNVVVWYEVKKKADGKGVEFKKHDFGTAAAGHGVGTGDVNLDGRTDLLTPKGWFEAPSDPANDTWAWHPDWNLGATGIQITAKDLDGDGKVELVYGMGHNFGLFWAKQSTGPDGKTVWTKMPIDERVASVHTQLWADVDGDGKAEELISGKRVYAHEIEPGATDGSLVAWYKFDPKAKAWTKHVIFQGEPAKNAPEKGPDRRALKDFPAGTAGTGLQVDAVDIDGDGDIDLVCPGKSGLYLFENLGTK
ncbi:FG-GAP repeat domain-containing protein [Paludisphaera rhizosphaerae]|uniref:FG-GAP repeat domain-containing protein n=1 Tax=Paludisphaera rhizosphaerae TaxID=2711216 RepID=UPI0013E9BA21|nr:VCBS repeat-containing protein [Paludisphaera rhizosphaerae]